MTVLIDDDFIKDFYNHHGRSPDPGGCPHWCPEWDDLPIDDLCPEFEACMCCDRRDQNDCAD